MPRKAKATSSQESAPPAAPPGLSQAFDTLMDELIARYPHGGFVLVLDKPGKIHRRCLWGNIYELIGTVDAHVRRLQRDCDIDIPGFIGTRRRAKEGQEPHG